MAETQTLLNVTQEKLPHSQIGLKIEIPGERSQQAYEKVITDLMRTAQIPGFRRGKTPRQVILQRFGADYLKASTLDSLVQSSLEQAIKQEELQILGNLQLRSDIEELVIAFQPGQALTFSASADIPPEVTLNKYKDFQLTVERTLFDPQRVDKTLEQQQSQHATLVPVEDRAALRGDVIMVDFTTQILRSEDAEAAESNPDDASDTEEDSESMTDFQVELVEDKFLPDFVNQVIGMSVGDTKNFEITFPEDYFSSNFAGQQVAFQVTLKDIKAKELPELSDDFAQEISEFETLAELRTFLNEQYESEAQEQTHGKVQEALVDALLAEMDVELPQTMVEQELNVLLNEMAVRFQSQGFDINQLFTRESIPGFKQRLQPDAQTRLKRTLALAHVAQAEDIQVEAETLESKFTETLAEFGQTKVDRNRLREVIADQILQEAVLEWLETQSQITLIDPSPETETETERTVETQARSDDRPDTEVAETVSVEAVATDSPVGDAEAQDPESKPKAKTPRTTKTPKAKSTDPQPEEPSADPEKPTKSTPAKTPRKRTSPKAKDAKEE